MFKVVQVLGCLTAGWLFCACGSDDSGPGDPVAACKQLVHVTCQKFYSCYSSTVLAQIADQVGTSEADCETKFEDCSATSTQCDAGKTYHAAAAQSCIDDFGSLTCAQLMGVSDGSTSTPSSCEKVCS